MEISTERENTLLVAKAGGRLDSINAREFDDAMRSAISESDQVVIMDLENVSYVSSAGLRVILLTAKTLQRTGREAADLLALGAHSGGLQNQRLRQDHPHSRE